MIQKEIFGVSSKVSKSEYVKLVYVHTRNPEQFTLIF